MVLVAEELFQTNSNLNLQKQRILNRLGNHHAEYHGHIKSTESSTEDCDCNDQTKLQLESTLLKNLTRISKGDVYEKYEVVELLGNGSMGTVSVVHLKDDKVGGSAFESTSRGFMGLSIGRKHRHVPLKDRPKPSSEYLYALKTLKLDYISTTYINEMYNEIDILRTLDHPNIIKVLDAYEDKIPGLPHSQIYMILELCSGGDLYARSPYSQREAGRIVSKIASALHYMHGQNIVHRDIKFENIMFENSEPDAEIKIIDFGLSKRFLQCEPDRMTERVGTMYTMAPQVLQGLYSSQADMWSLGVISYMLLSSSKPFYAKNKKKLIDLIMRGAVSYDAPIWQSIDESAKDFVKRLLVLDPKERMTAADAVKHEWITNKELMPDDKPSEEILSKLDNCLLRYKYTSKLKKIALNIIAHESTTAEILELRKVFEALDKEGNGLLTFDQFREGLMQCLEYSDSDIEDLFSSIDINHNGHIMYTEFLAATLEAQGQIEEDKIAEAFDRIDRDAKGYISKKDIAEALGHDCSKQHVLEVMKAADYDNDGRISYHEFLRHFRETRNKFTKDKKVVGSPLSSFGDPDSELLGLDAVIPGGRYTKEEKCSF